jgi:hypothetical protein
MSNTDIRPFGTSPGLGFYWVQEPHPFGGGSLRLIAISEVGEVTRTPRGEDWDDAALTQEQAVALHLRAAAAEADRDLKQRRKDAPEPKPEPPPRDPATERFFYDG